MSTSAKRQNAALIYTAVSLFCAAFGAIYEYFSHGVISWFMIYAFAIPLTLGALPWQLMAMGIWRGPGRAGSRLWACAVATFTVGSVFQGVLEIFGTTNSLIYVYPAAGALLLLAAIVVWMTESAENS